MTPELVSSGLVPVIIAIAGLAVLVLGSFQMLTRRMDRDLKRVDEEKSVLAADNKALRDRQYATEDKLHTVEREAKQLKSERDDLMQRFDNVSAQVTYLTEQQNRLDGRVQELQRELEAERRSSRSRIDAEQFARTEAERKASTLEAEVKVLVAEKNALATRLEDQARLHRAEIEALQLKLSQTTDELRGRIDELKAERLKLETRVQELESKGVDLDGV